MNKARLKKVLEKLPVKDQLIKLRQELKDKRNKELFAFLQQTIKNVESKKPIHEVKSESQSLLENLDKKKEESSPLEAKIEAEKPAFQVDEKIYGIKPSSYEAKDLYQAKPAELKEKKEESNPAIGFFKKMKEYESNLEKPTEKYKRKEKLF